MQLQSLVKRLMSNDAVLGLISAVITLYIRLVWSTSRFDTVGRELTESLVAEGNGVIFAFWHQRLIGGPMLRVESDRRVFMLSSHHRDAEMVANAVRPFGVEFIRGSAADPNKKFRDKGGATAVAQMIAVLKDGDLVGMTPDGPRGPRRVVQPGIVRLAQLSGAPILAGAYSASRGMFLNTWDQFFLALPFSRGVFVAGAPIRVPADATPEALESARRTLEASLNEATDAADRAVGRSPEGARLR